MPLTNPTIAAIPAAPDPDYPALTSITVADLVGPVAANRQPNEIAVRSDTTRDAVNELVANMNELSTGEGADLLCLPRDGSLAMTANLDAGTNKIINLTAGAAATTDASNVQQMEAAVGVLSLAALLRDGSQAATGDLDMGSNKIINLTDPNPANPAEALNIGFADARYGGISTSKMKLIESIVIAGSDVATVDFATVLDGDTDEQWVITGKWRFTMNVGRILSLRINGGLSSPVATFVEPTGGNNTVVSNAWFRSDLTVQSNADADLNVRHALTLWTANQTFGGFTDLGSGFIGADFNLGVGVNIISLGFAANVGTNIRIGSQFSLYKLER